MKKITLFLLIFCICLSTGSLFGCKNNSSSVTGDGSGYWDNFPSSGGDSQNSTNNNVAQQVSVQYYYCGEFKDGYAITLYKRSGEFYGAIIDTSGKIIYEAPSEDADEWKHFGNGRFLVWNDGENSSRIFSIIDSDGKTVTSFENGEFDEVIVSGNGVVVVYKKATKGVSIDHQYGTIDRNGNWNQTLTSGEKKYNNWYGTPEYLDEGMFYIGNYMLYNSNTGFTYFLDEIDWASKKGDIKFRNGIAYTKTKDEQCVLLKTDGTFLETDEFWLSSGGMIAKQIGGYVQISDPSTNKIVNTNFMADNVYDVICYQDGNILLKLKGYDENRLVYFFTMLDSNGKQFFDPVQCVDSVHFYSNGLITYNKDYTYAGVVDIMSGKILFDGVKQFEFCGGFYNGIAPMNVPGAYDSNYINTKGEYVLQTLTK